jgi:hypothetical protein
MFSQEVVPPEIAAGLSIARFGDPAALHAIAAGMLVGTSPLYRINARGLGKRDNDPISAMMLTANV